MNEFKVGDVVKIIDGPYEINIGHFGVVQSLRTGTDLTIRTKPINTIGYPGRTDWYMYKNELEKVELE